MNKFLLVLSVVFLAIILTLGKINLELLKDKNTLKTNISVLEGNNRVYEAKNGQLVYENGILKKSKSELSDSLENEIKNLKISSKKVNNFSKINLVASDTIAIKYIYKESEDTCIDNSRRDLYWEYKDEYISLNGWLDNDSIKVVYEYRDSIAILRTKGIKPKLTLHNIFRRRKEEKILVTSKNPNAKFSVYSIDIK